MNKEMLLILVRHSVTFGAGMIFVEGSYSTSEVEMVSGALVTLIMVGWSKYDQYRKHKEVKEIKAENTSLKIENVVLKNDKLEETFK